MKLLLWGDLVRRIRPTVRGNVDQYMKRAKFYLIIAFPLKFTTINLFTTKNVFKAHVGIGLFFDSFKYIKHSTSRPLNGIL